MLFHVGFGFIGGLWSSEVQGILPEVPAHALGDPLRDPLNLGVNSWCLFVKRDSVNSALGKWGRKQMGSDGFNRILTGFHLLDPARVRLVPSETHDFKGFGPDFNRILTGL